jgi:hypothetical protein
MNESLHLYLNATEVHLRRVGGPPWRRKVEELNASAWDMADPGSLKLDGLPPAGAWRRPLHVYAGSALGKFMAIDLPQGLRDESEARAAAQAQMQHQLGLQAADWHFTLDRAVAPAKSIVCAVRRNAMERLQSLAQENGLRLVSLKPFVAGVWNAVQRKAAGDGVAQSALVAIEDDAFTVLVEASGKLVSMSTLSHRRESDLVDREIRRLGYSFGTETHGAIRIALPRHLSALAQAVPEKVVLREDYMEQGLYANFRDLLFASSPGEKG